jgi:hypothetical protein
MLQLLNLLLLLAVVLFLSYILLYLFCSWLHNNRLLNDFVFLHLSFVL